MRHVMLAFTVPQVPPCVSLVLLARQVMLDLLAVFLATVLAVK